MPVQTPESQDVIQLRPPVVEIDMQDYGHTLLDDAGNLELRHDLPAPVEIQIGNSALTLMSIEHPLVPGQPMTDEERRNLPRAFAISHKDGGEGSRVLFGDMEGLDREVVVGRGSTNELVKGDPTVSGRHLKLEADHGRRSIRIHDLDSTNSTRIKVRVDKVVLPHGKEHVRRNGRVMTKPEAHGRWER